MTPLNQSIRATLAFFQIFGRPLKTAEVWRWLWETKDVTEQEVQQQLKGMKDIEEKEGDWYLKGYDYPARGRQKQINAALRSRAFRYLPGLKYIPGMRFCGIGNTLAFGAADEESDIDLFIIAQPGMLWFVRLATTFVLHLQGVRRHGKKVAGRFCLSFFIDEEAMDLSRIAIEDDVYLRYWIATLLPIFGEETWANFQQQNAVFVGEKIPHAFPGVPTGPAPGNPFLEKILLSWGKPLLRFVRWMQQQKMRHLPVTLGPGAYVVVNDHMLKFHNNDRRKHFRDIWRTLLSS